MDLQERKIINAIKYFVKNTKFVGRTKLFKLLYFWDFMFLQRHGKIITGYEYYTYPFGPVPDKLYKEITSDGLSKEFSNNLYFQTKDDLDEDAEYPRFEVRLKNSTISYDYFTPYEKAMLELVADIFKEATGKQMTEISHLPNLPWAITIKEKGMLKSIDMMLAKTQETPFDEIEIKERLYLQKSLTTHAINT